MKTSEMAGASIGELKDQREWALEARDIVLLKQIDTELHSRMKPMSLVIQDMAVTFKGEGGLCPYCGKSYLRREIDNNDGIEYYIHADYGEGAMMRHKDWED